MVRFQKPDWKCVFTYVQSFYRRFRDGRSPSPKPPVGAGVKLSEVALAVAETQAAEQRGRQIVQEVRKEVKQEKENTTKIENDTTEVRMVEDKIQTNEEKENDKAVFLHVLFDKNNVQTYITVFTNFIKRF